MRLFLTRVRFSSSYASIFFSFFFSFYIVRALRRSTNVRSIVLRLLDASGVEATVDQRQ